MRKQTTSQRKWLAIMKIVNNQMRSRSFDNCFEMYDGTEVVLGIMEWAHKKSYPILHGERIIIGSKRWTQIRESEKRNRLIINLKEAGMWNNWLKVYQEHNAQQLSMAV